MVVAVSRKPRVTYRSESRAPKPSKKRDWRWFLGDDGRYHRYLNHDVPTGYTPLDVGESLCKVCGYGYSELIGDKKGVCNECAWDTFIVQAAKMSDDMGHDFGIGKGMIRDARNVDDLAESLKRYGMRIVHSEAVHGQKPGNPTERGTAGHH
jgi:hypothetical protein